MKKKKISHASEIKSLLDSAAIEHVSKMKESGARKLYKKIVKEEWKHAKWQ